MARRGAIVSAGGRGLEAKLVAALLLSCVGLSAAQINFTMIAERFPDYSVMAQWYNQTGVAQEIASRNQSSITLLAAPNAIFNTYLSTVPNANGSSALANTLRYNVLLQYFSIAELRALTAIGVNVTTLLQTTGSANDTQGFVKLFNNGTAYLASHVIPDRTGNVSVITNITQVAYVYSILRVSNVLSPFTVALSPTPSPSPAPTPVPAPSPTARAPSPILTPMPAAASPPALSSTMSPTGSAEGPAGSTSSSSPDNSFAVPKGVGGAQLAVILLAMLLSYTLALC